MSYKLLLFIPFLLISCSNEPPIEIPEDIASMENVATFSGDAEPQYDITLTEEARFGETDEILIRSISGAAVSEDGRLFVTDLPEAIVHAYAPNGDYMFSIGGKGEGPGEFIGATQPELLNKELHVLDVQQQRVSVFNPENGDLIRTHSLSNDGSDLSGFPFMFEPLSDDRYLAYYYAMNRDGDKVSGKLKATVLDTDANVINNDFIDFNPIQFLLLQDENNIQMMELEFESEPKVSISPDEKIVWGYNERILIHIVDLEGNIDRSIYYSRTNPAFNRPEFLTSYEPGPVKDALSSYELPETKNAFESIYVDEDYRIWISLPTEEDNTYEWWVLGEEGEKLATFSKSSEDQLLEVKNSFAYFLETEEETGLQEIAKYKFELE